MFRKFTKIFNKILFFSFFIYSLTLNLSLAQSQTALPSPAGGVSLPDFKDIGDLLKNFNGNILQNLVVLLSGAAVVLFLWGLVRFILHRSEGGGDKGSSVEADKKNMLWGLGALFVLVTLWGIIGLAQDILELPKDNSIHIPKICLNDNCDNRSSQAVANGVGENTSTGTCPSGTTYDTITTQCVPKLGGSTTIATAAFTGDYTIEEVQAWKVDISEKTSQTANEEVAQLQKILNQYSGANLKIDGIFGPATTQALKDFQRKSKLVPDGILGPSTQAVILYRYLKASPQNNLGYVLAWSDLALGSQGNSVTQLQTLLNERECFQTVTNSNEDGNFGPATQAAVGNFQDKNALTEDHIVGPSTRAVLVANYYYNCN